MNIQLYNSTEKKSLLVNFLDFPFSIFQLYNSTAEKYTLVNLSEFPFSNSTTLQENNYANNLINLQLYNSTAEKYTIVNFSDFSFLKLMVCYSV